jgi:hypothetical protein
MSLLQQIFENTQITNSIKLVQWQAHFSMRTNTDKHDEADSRFSQFSECAQKKQCGSVTK